MSDIDYEDVKAASETAVLGWGGTTNQWLPIIGEGDIHLRDSADAARRCAALCAMTAVSEGMKCAQALAWLQKSGCESGLDETELDILLKHRSAPWKMRRLLAGHREALWAAAWVGGLCDDLTPVDGVPKELAKALPNPRRGGTAEQILDKYRLRPLEELYRKLDLFYRAHWHEVNSRLSGQPTGRFRPEQIVPRRWLLEWVMNSEAEWCEVDLST